MHPKIEELMNYIQEKFHLNNFQYTQHFIFREKNINNQPTDTVNFEWVSGGTPKEHHLSQQEVVHVDIDLHTKKITALTFPETLTIPAENILPAANNVDSAIAWIEQETGLAFGKQFKLVENNQRSLYFQAAVDKIPVFPNGEIVLKFYEDRKFNQFSISGRFPKKEEIDWKPFSLTKAQTNPIAKKYLEQVKVPLNEDEKWLACYMLPPCFIANEGENSFRAEEFQTKDAAVFINQTLEWQEQEKVKLSDEAIDLSIETTIEAALQNTEQVKEITTADQITLTKNVINYLATLYPNDSGKWKLQSFHLENRYLIANLVWEEPIRQIPQKRLSIFLDEQTFQAINHETNSRLIQQYESFTLANETKITKEEAFQLLEEHINLQSVYLYNQLTGNFEVFGKVHCDIAVLADTGELISLHG